MIPTFSLEELQVIIKNVKDVALDDPRATADVAVKAARFGHLATLRYLAAEGVDLSGSYANGAHGPAPITVAVANGHGDVVAFLKDQPSVDINRPLNGSRPANLAELARDKGHAELADKIEEWCLEKACEAYRREREVYSRMKPKTPEGVGSSSFRIIIG